MSQLQLLTSNTSSLLLSTVERDVIRRGVDQDLRVDGRTRMDQREYTLETGLLAHANGSSRVRLGFAAEQEDAVDVLCVVKAEIAETASDRPMEGRIVCRVDVYIIIITRILSIL
jgi:exosome complex component RRP42